MTFRLPFVGPSEIKSKKGGTVRYVIKHNVIYGQSEYRNLCVLLATRTCTVWRYVLFLICQSIRRHFKGSVETLIKS